MRNKNIRTQIPSTIVGGMRIACLSRNDTVTLINAITSGERQDCDYPVVMTSANGQVLSEYARSPAIRSLFDDTDLVNADGQPMVFASSVVSKRPLPERVATTDLFHDVSMAAKAGTRYFMLGATRQEVERAVSTTRRLYPHIDIVGFSHGHFSAREESALIARINTAAPDILWIAMGVPREQQFALANRERLDRVKVIKTGGGLFNYLSGTRSRAPAWMQAAGLEWLYRLVLEPRRLLRRYLVTNCHSVLLLLTRTR